jgi:nucleotide-binding universal stress UspA family protein
VDVVEPFSYSSLGAVAWGEPLQEELRSRQAALTSLAGVNGEAVLGLTDQQLVTLSGEVDLLIVGSRGYGRFGRVVHNSVSHYLAGHARCPLLVLPRPAIAGPERDRLVENTADSDLGT